MAQQIAPAVSSPPPRVPAGGSRATSVPLRVVVSPPSFDQHLRLAQRVEAFACEQLVTEFAVEVLDISVLPRAGVTGGMRQARVAACCATRGAG